MREEENCIKFFLSNDVDGSLKLLMEKECLEVQKSSREEEALTLSNETYSQLNSHIVGLRFRFS